VTDEEAQQLAAELRERHDHWDWSDHQDLHSRAADAIAGLLADKQHLQAAVARLDEALLERDDARAEVETLEDDLLRVLRVRNEALLAAAAELHPGPDGQDYLDRERLIREWVDEGHERVDEKDRQLTEAVARFASLSAEVVSLRERLAAVNAGTCRYVSMSDEGTAYCTLAETSSERVWARVVELETALRGLANVVSDYAASRAAWASVIERLFAARRVLGDTKEDQ
jgi:chromosome segregation ATPase